MRGLFTPFTPQRTYSPRAAPPASFSTLESHLGSKKDIQAAQRAHNSNNHSFIHMLSRHGPHMMNHGHTSMGAGSEPNPTASTWSEPERTGNHNPRTPKPPTKQVVAAEMPPKGTRDALGVLVRAATVPLPTNVGLQHVTLSLSFPCCLKSMRSTFRHVVRIQERTKEQAPCKREVCVRAVCQLSPSKQGETGDFVVNQLYIQKAPLITLLILKAFKTLKKRKPPPGTNRKASSPQCGETCNCVGV